MIDILRDQDTLRRARDEFLTTGSASAEVRPATLRSWQRCLAAGVAPDHPVELPYSPVSDHISVLLRAATPIVDELVGRLGGADAAMLLMDRQARVVGRWSGSQLFMRQLDRVSGGPGYNFDERHAGTNALGTTLTEKEPTVVVGGEHYVSSLQSLSAVGAPILHPVTKRVEGVIDLVCPVPEFSSLAVPLMVTAAADIGRGLLSGYAELDHQLLDGFLRQERRGPRRAMLAINSRVYMTNPLAADLLTSARHAEVWEQVVRAIRNGSQTVVLESTLDASIRGWITCIGSAQNPTGAVVALHREMPLHTDTPAEDPRITAVGRHLATVLPGRSRLLQHALTRSARAAADNGELVLIGPAGSGKRTLARGLLGAKRVLELDCRGIAGADASRALVDFTSRAVGAQAALLTHLELLDPVALGRLSQWIEAVRSPDTTLIAAFTADDAQSIPAGLLGQFASVIELPALNNRREDIPAIVSSILASIGDRRNPRLDAAALQQLSNRDWPGGIRQLRQVVLAALRHSGSGRIETRHLAESPRTTPVALTLSRLESIERDAIVAMLRTRDGNKKAAAQDLGISRATLYRKLRAFGLCD